MRDGGSKARRGGDPRLAVRVLLVAVVVTPWLVGLTGVVALSLGNAHARALSAELVEESTTIVRLQSLLEAAERSAGEFSFTSRPEAAERYGRIASEIDRLLEEPDAFDEPGERDALRRVRESWQTAKRTAAPILDRSVSFPESVASLDVFYPSVGEALDALQALVKLNAAEIAADDARRQSDALRLLMAIALIAIAVAIFGIATARRAVQAVVRPLNRLVRATRDIGEGDMTTRLPDDQRGEFGNVFNAFNTMTDRLEHAHDTLAHQALHDSLTDAANRTSLEMHTAESLSALTTSELLAIALIDLDDFKAINDTLGHGFGDHVLIEVCRRLYDCIGEHDVVSRLSADEFAVLLLNVEDHQHAVRRIEAVIAAVSQPLLVDGRNIVIAVSAGVAVAEPGETASELLRNADIALYQAKAHNRGHCELFDRSLLDALQERRTLEHELRSALETNEIEVHYQPTLWIKSGSIAGAEALVRWRHPERGLLPPLRFVGLAEATGLIVPLGLMVLEQACRQTRQWQDAIPSLRDMSISVNVSPRQLREPNIVAQVRRVLSTTRLRPDRLTLEVTESIFADDAGVERLHELKALGVRIALDDFGTGYASLSYLERLPVDILKLDKSFVDELPQRADRSALVAGVLNLAQAFDLQTIAEGVENIEQLRILASLGCDIVQGYFFAEPAPHVDIEQFFAGHMAMPDDVVAALDPTRRSANDLRLVHLDMGPIPSTQVLAWCDYAELILREFGTDSEHHPPLPAGVLAAMQHYIATWRCEASKSDSFSWTGDEDADLLWSIVHYWFQLAASLAQRATASGIVASPPEAMPFYEAVVGRLLSALASEDYGVPGAVSLQRTWPRVSV